MNPYFVIALLFIMACAYSAQYWASKCYRELREINEKLSARSPD